MSMSARAQANLSRYSELVGTSEAFLDANATVTGTAVALTEFVSQAQLDKAAAVVIHINANGLVVRFTGDDPTTSASAGKIYPEGSNFVVQGADIGNLRMVYWSGSEGASTTIHIELRR